MTINEKPFSLARVAVNNKLPVMSIGAAPVGLAMLVLFLAISMAAAAIHPVLISQSRLAALAAGGPEWNALKKTCEDNLNVLIAPGYAGWGWRDAAVNYATAYQVLRASDPATANQYGAKALALMKVLARHHNYGGPGNAQLLGQGDGSRKSFSLPMTPRAGTKVVLLKTPVAETAHAYNASTIVLPHFDPIVKISDTSGGVSTYASSDYRLYYRDGLTICVLKWLTSHHPAPGATYYVSMTKGEGTPVAAGQYAITGTTVTLTTAPTATEAVFARYLAENYDQTGNFMGGVSSVMPDGPGYQMRTFNPGLAYGFDLLYDFPGFTPELKAEFVEVLNQQIDWFKAYGYEHNGDLGNYFIRGLLTGTMFTAYGTEGANSRSDELKKLADNYMQRPFGKLDQKLPGGYGPQGQYANGVAADVLQVFSIYKDLTGRDLLSQLEWTANIIPATIHGTKPDRVTFYDGGDWSDLPAVPLKGQVDAFLTYLPNHAMAPYARQFLKDMGKTPPPGAILDYKTNFPPAYFAKVSGPIYARCDWGTDAVWVSLSAGEVFMDHQANDQGKVTIQRGGDYLLCDGGGYGDLKTEYHNTLLFDDRGAGNISTYPPDQGPWGFGSVGLRAFEQTAGYVYGLADFTRAYAAAHEGTRNSVKLAARSVVFIRPNVVVVHDRAQSFNAEVKKYANWNFSATPIHQGNVTTVTAGKSTMFMQSLLPADATPIITPITTHGQPIAKSNYRVMVTGRQNDSFLHVFEVEPNTQTTMRPTGLVNGGLVEGAEVLVGQTTWVAVFAKTENVLNGPVSYGFSASGPHRHIVTDLPKNLNYQVTVTVGGQKIPNEAASSATSNGLLSFAFNATGAGQVVITPTPSRF